MAKAIIIRLGTIEIVQVFVITLLSIQGTAANNSLARPDAVSIVNMGPVNSSVRGVVEFHEEARINIVSIKGEIHGLPPNTEHGFHIHENGDLRDPQNPCNSAGAHYNPFKMNHGGPNDTFRHVGDLGNIVAGADGVARIDVNVTKVQLNGLHAIIGRAVVVHEKMDDLGKDGGDSKKTGNAGRRIACGVIGIAQKKLHKLVFSLI